MLSLICDDVTDVFHDEIELMNLCGEDQVFDKDR